MLPSTKHATSSHYGGTLPLFRMVIMYNGRMHLLRLWYNWRKQPVTDGRKIRSTETSGGWHNTCSLIIIYLDVVYVKALLFTSIDHFHSLAPWGVALPKNDTNYKTSIHLLRDVSYGSCLRYSRGFELQHIPSQYIVWGTLARASHQHQSNVYTQTINFYIWVSHRLSHYYSAVSLSPAFSMFDLASQVVR